MVASSEERERYLHYPLENKETGAWYLGSQSGALLGENDSNDLNVVVVGEGYHERPACFVKIGMGHPGIRQSALANGRRGEDTDIGRPGALGRGGGSKEDVVAARACASSAWDS